MVSRKFRGILLFTVLTLTAGSGQRSINYAEFNSDSFMPLLRVKRDMPALELEGDIFNATALPSDVEKAYDTSEHIYYNMSISINNTEEFSKYYVDIENWLKNKDIIGQMKHDHLNDAYRKAASVKLSFNFPFYGHLLTNMTIATGGFIYVGDQTHSWLAATQYIAPLMANFDTMAENATIMYADDGHRMVVEWYMVTLRDNKNAGNFTFQVSLWDSGNITFVYKDVPLPVSNISDSHHPCKLGISDAYLFTHKVAMDKIPSLSQNKRVIHEYHRITVPSDKITSHTVVHLTALPNCLNAKTCHDCQKFTLNHFNCSWCSPKEKEKSGDGFCTDEMGMNRRRQEFVEGGCQSTNLQKDSYYCPSEPSENGTATVAPEQEAQPTVVPTSALTTDANHPDKVVTLSSTTSTTQKIDTEKQATKDGGGGGLAFFTLFFIVGISVSLWILYAFYNPHTTSGQLLIKYRPSKWQIPSSHVRYSASVHM